MLQCQEARRQSLVSGFVSEDCREVQSALQEKSHIYGATKRQYAVYCHRGGKLQFDTAGVSMFVLCSAPLSKNFGFIFMKVVYIKGLGK